MIETASLGLTIVGVLGLIAANIYLAIKRPIPEEFLDRWDWW